MKISIAAMLEMRQLHMLSETSLSMKLEFSFPNFTPVRCYSWDSTRAHSFYCVDFCDALDRLLGRTRRRRCNFTLVIAQVAVGRKGRGARRFTRHMIAVPPASVGCFSAQRSRFMGKTEITTIAESARQIGRRHYEGAMT